MIALILTEFSFPYTTLKAQAQSGVLVDPKPLVVIGMVDGPQHFLFQFLTEARLLPNGNLLVADRTLGELREFKRSGEFVRSFGGQGAGPAEFRHISGVAIHNDTIIVVDPILGKLAYFSLDGEFLSTSPMRQFGMSLIGVGVNGRRWWSWMVGQVAGPANNLTADSIVIGVSDSQTSLKEIAGAVVTWRFRKIPYPFSPVTRPALFRDSLLVADPLSGHISIVDLDGKFTRSIKIPLSRVNEPEAWRVLEQQVAVRDDLSARRDWEIPRVDQLPRMGAMMVDERDHIWIKVYDPLEDAHWLGGWAGGEGGKWLILDGQGTTLGTVTLPSRLTPLYIGTDLLLGRYRDEWDVQYLAVYNVRFKR